MEKVSNNQRVTFLKCPKMGSKIIFWIIFLIKGFLGLMWGAVQSLLQFRLNITILVPPGKSVTQAKSHIFKGSKNGVKNFFFFFFLIKGFLGPMRGAVQSLLPFWREIKYKPPPWKDVPSPLCSGWFYIFKIGSLWHLQFRPHVRC